MSSNRRFSRSDTLAAVSDEKQTDKHGAEVVLLAMQASAETRFEQLTVKLGAVQSLSPEGILRVRAELGALLQ